MPAALPSISTLFMFITKSVSILLQTPENAVGSCILMFRGSARSCYLETSGKIFSRCYAIFRTLEIRILSVLNFKRPPFYNIKSSMNTITYVGQSVLLLSHSTNIGKDFPTLLQNIGVILGTNLGSNVDQRNNYVVMQILVKFCFLKVC